MSRFTVVCLHLPVQANDFIRQETLVSATPYSCATTLRCYYFIIHLLSAAETVYVWLDPYSYLMYIRLSHIMILQFAKVSRMQICISKDSRLPHVHKAEEQ